MVPGIHEPAAHAQRISQLCYDAWRKWKPFARQSWRWQILCCFQDVLVMTKTTNCGSVKERYKKNEDAMEAGLAARPDGGMGRELLKPSASSPTSANSRLGDLTVAKTRTTWTLDAFHLLPNAWRPTWKAMPWQPWHGDCFERPSPRKVFEVVIWNLLWAAKGGLPFLLVHPCPSYLVEIQVYRAENHRWMMGPQLGKCQDVATEAAVSKSNLGSKFSRCRSNLWSLVSLFFLVDLWLWYPFCLYTAIYIHTYITLQYSTLYLHLHLHLQSFTFTFAFAYYILHVTFAITIMFTFYI